ncbi:unnamed protein product [Caenorhabditis auriculariae]|uniref:Solute carrier family 25 member 46 n=1 Tax=Caenorhabditis auriculariae TaxID=2777116 RepID=A0A8S1GSI8_9PELO|nr:unnamed protein product [Caenorhabditis auriculariae]
MSFIQSGYQHHPPISNTDYSKFSPPLKAEHGLPSTSSIGDDHFSNVSPVLGSNSPQDPLAGALLGLSDIITKTLISHPCAVVRRQCQVHQFARSAHITPITLVPVLCNAVAKEGIQTFWKGAIGSSVIWGLSNVTEIVIGDLFGLPRNIVTSGSSEKYWKHVILKACTYFVMTPFYVSSFIETVRSESGLGSDDNRVMDVLVKGVDRLRLFVFSGRDPSRRFSILHLAVPTVGYRTTHYIIQTALYNQFFRMAKRYVNRKPEVERTRFHEYLPQLFAQMTSSVLTDLILFPVETILHRMYIQGTRTLIDNMDTGVSAVSMSVKYSGFFNCLKQVVEREGVRALYAGVGALALEYMLHSGLQQLVRACFDRGSEMLRRATNSQATVLSPPLTSKNSFSGFVSGPLSGPFAQQPMSPITVNRLPLNVSSPPRDPTQFPTFGETVSQLNSPYGPPPPFGTSSRSNVFGSPPNRRDFADDSSKNALPPLILKTDSDPFSG